MKRPGRHPTRRTKSSRSPAPEKGPSSKARAVVRLVEALTAGLGSSDGVLIGRGIADLLANVYGEQRRPIPRWVEQLSAHYAPPRPKP